MKTPAQNDPLSNALVTAVSAHREQSRTLPNGQTEPYVCHPLRVMLSLGQDASVEEKMAAVLHDVIEDTPWDADDLINVSGVPVPVVKIVLALSRRPDETYEEFIDRVILFGEPAITIKLADIADNLASLHGEYESLRERYLKAQAKLLHTQVELTRA